MPDPKPPLDLTALLTPIAAKYGFAPEPCSTEEYCRLVRGDACVTAYSHSPSLLVALDAFVEASVMAEAFRLAEEVRSALTEACS